MVIDVQLEVVDEPFSQFAKREAVAHRHRAGAHETLPACAQSQALDRTADRVGAIKHPYRLAILCGRFEHIEQRRYERVDTAAEILQVDQHHIARAHHLPSGATAFAIEAEHRNAVDRIVEIRAFDHVVLLIATHAVLRAKS